MPKSQLDWLGVVSLWLGALLLAIKSAAVPLMVGAPAFLAADFWNYVPLVLITPAMGIFLYRQMRPVSEGGADTAVALKLSLPDAKAQALTSLKKARDSAAIALSLGTPQTRRRAFHEAEAAMLNIEREFGIAPLALSPETAADVPYDVLVEAYVAFIDRFYPLLREGHIEKAKERAREFKWSWGEKKFPA